ncbi:MAG: hypothetical protein V1652_02125 [bacterium]
MSLLRIFFIAGPFVLLIVRLFIGLRIIDTSIANIQHLQCSKKYSSVRCKIQLIRLICEICFGILISIGFLTQLFGLMIALLYLMIGIYKILTTKSFSAGIYELLIALLGLVLATQGAGPCAIDAFLLR